MPKVRASKAPLPQSLEAAHQRIIEQSFLIEKLQFQMERLMKSRFGSKADKINPPDPQADLFAAAAAAQEAESEEPPADEFGYKQSESPKKGHGRRKLSICAPHLPREVVRLELAEADRLCKCCGKAMPEIGCDCSERIEYQPASLKVVVEERPQYACSDKACDSGVVSVPVPVRVIDKCMAGPGLLGQVVVSKYADHLPLNRQEAILQRHGLEISRKTMCGWMAMVADGLKPLYELEKAQAFESHCLGSDETGVPVQDKGGPKMRIGRLWAHVGDEEHPYNVFEFTPSRESVWVNPIFSQYRGKLQVDACPIYNPVFAKGEATEVGCWAHARRKFVEAQDSDPQRAAAMVEQIGLLYKVEKEARGRSPAERLELRREQSAPQLERIKAWLDKEQHAVLPKSPMGQAISYSLRQWKALGEYVGDGRVPIDNNRTELALRAVVIGRKNWLFCGSDAGGHTAAVLCSLIASAKRHRLDLLAYMTDVITRISAHPMSRLAEFLPDQWAQAHPQHVRAPSPTQ